MEANAMNTNEILYNGHVTVLKVVQAFPTSAWEKPGVCGVWSAKDVVAHLASFEQVLVEVLSGFLGDDATPTLDRFIVDIETFNRAEVARRQDRSASEILAEYKSLYEQAAHLLGRIPPEMRWQNGTLPWYGEDYDLDDFIVYSVYGHKQEHCTQLVLFGETLAKERDKTIARL
jgi:hypothetical protein